MAPRVLYYALGGGLGHGVRTLALARHAARRIRGTHRILANSPFAESLAQEARRNDGLDLIALPPTTTAAEVQALVDRHLRQWRPDLWVVDTFPRGMGGELVDLLSRGDRRRPGRVLVARHLPRKYIDTYDLRRFVSSHYDMILGPGETTGFEGLADFRRTAPFLIRDHDELPSPAAARRILNVDRRRRVLLVVGSGTPAESREWLNQAQRLVETAPSDWSVRAVMPRETAPDRDEPWLLRRFPLLDCLAAASVVVGSAGYNLFHELRAVGVPGIQVPQPRRYDDQRGRASGSQWAGAGEFWRHARNLADTRPTTSPSYINGAADGVSQLIELDSELVSQLDSASSPPVMPLS